MLLFQSGDRQMESQSGLLGETSWQNTFLESARASAYWDLLQAKCCCERHGPGSIPRQRWSCLQDNTMPGTCQLVLAGILRLVSLGQDQWHRYLHSCLVLQRRVGCESRSVLLWSF